MGQKPRQGSDSPQSGFPSQDSPHVSAGDKRPIVHLDEDYVEQVAEAGSNEESGDTAGPDKPRRDAQPESMGWIRRGSAVRKAIGAVLTTLIVAGLTTIEWDGYQRETDLRAALVGDVNTSIAHVVVSTSLIATGAVGIDKKGEVNIPSVKKKHNEVRRDWEEDAARIRGQLQAYYSDMSVGQEWQEYAAILSDYLMLSYPKPQNKDPVHLKKQANIRRVTLGRIERYLQRKGEGLQPSLKKTILHRSKDIDDYSQGYELLGRMFSDEQARLNKTILSSDTRIAPPFGIVRLFQKITQR